MKSILKKLTATIAVMSCFNIVPVANAVNLPYFEYSYCGIYNLNDDTNDSDEMLFCENGAVHGLNGKAYYQAVDFMVDSSVKDVDNEYLEISDEYSIIKVKAKGCNIYRVEAKDETEMNNLFKSAKKLCDNKKIQNVYTLEYCDFPYLEKTEFGDYLTLDMISLAFLRNYYIYNEETVKASAIEGDANEDFLFNVRDCAHIAKKLLIIVMKIFQN